MNGTTTDHQGWKAIGLAALAITAFSITVINPDTNAIFVAGIAIGFPSALGALFAGLDLIIYRLSLHVREYHEAKSITPASTYVRQIGRLTENQAKLAEGTTLTALVEVITGHGSATFMARTANRQVGTIPMEFVRDFIETCIHNGDPRALAPIRLWTHGSRNQTWARVYTDHLITLGLALPAAGNQPARWTIPLEDIAKSTGLEQLGMIPSNLEDAIHAMRQQPTTSPSHRNATDQ